jgi:hypothetical protein
VKVGPAALCTLGALCIALALQLNNGLYDPVSLALAALGTVLAVAGAVWLRLGAPPEDPLVVRSLLGFGCAAGIACQLLLNPTSGGPPLPGFRWMAVCALVVLSAYLCTHLRASLVQARFQILLVCFLVMGIAVLRNSPQPWVDVWVVQQGGAQALSLGRDPYSMSYPNIYGALTSKMYAPQLLQNNRLIAYAYPPLTVLLNLPAFSLFGDIRVVSLLAMVGAAFALARALQGPTGELAGLFILFQPRSFFVLEQAWTEPLVLAAFAFALWAVLRAPRQWVLLGLALGLLLASKQYAPLLLLPLFLLIAPEQRWRSLGLAAALVCAVTLPFLIWDAQGLFRGVVQMQFLQPFREDALSLLALYQHRTGAPPPFGAAPAFVAAAVVLAVTLRRRLHAGLAVSAAAAAWLVFVLFNKQAFCNYDWLGAGLLGTAAAAQCERN